MQFSILNCALRFIQILSIMRAKFYFFMLALSTSDNFVAGATFRGDHDSWKDLAPIPIAPRQEHTVVAVSDTTLAIVGGIVPNGTTLRTTSLMQFYNIPTNEWTRVSALPIEVNHPNVAAVGGKIYLLGGLIVASDGAWRGTADCWVYDLDHDIWSKLESLPPGTGRGSAILGVHGKRIYLAGGMQVLNPVPGGEQDTVDMINVFDTGSNTWIAIPEAAENLPEGRDHGTGAIIEDKFYVIGGRRFGQVNVKDTVFVLDLQRLDAGWTTSSGKMPTARGGLASGVVGNLIYTFGGEGNPAEGSKGVFNETEVLNTKTGAWTRLQPMKLPRHGTWASSVGGKIYIPGGGISQGAGPVNTLDVYSP
jgi:N-acetylneuraminic acid mutarotase